MILILIGAAVFGGASAFILVVEGTSFLEQGTDLYMDRVAHQVKELDKLYVRVDPHKMFYLNLTSCFAVFAAVSVFTSSMLIGLICTPAGLLVPRFWIRLMRTRRLRLFNTQFMEAIGGISNALKSGLSLRQAIERAGMHYPAPLSQELSMVSKETALGVTLEQSLENLCARVGSEDLDLFVTATAIVRDTGGNLSEMFDTIADTLRERNTIQGKIKALTAQGRLQGIVIGLMPVALGFILYKLDPNLILPLFHDPLGWLILFMIVLFEAMGAFFIRKIIRIDV